MSEQAATPSTPKPKKSVALSGTPAGNTALCTVGRSGNDLHYRGYDILDFADRAEFEAGFKNVFPVNHVQYRRRPRVRVSQPSFCGESL